MVWQSSHFYFDALLWVNKVESKFIPMSDVIQANYLST